MKVIGFNKKNLIALAIAVVLAATSFGVYQAQAAGKVDTDADVTITANVSEQEAFYKNYSKYNGKYDVEIKLYKLASVDESGQIGKCNLTGVDLTALSANKVTVADVKSKIVNPAVTAVDGKDADATITVDMTTKTGSVTIKKGAGVYLYVPQVVKDDRYTYKFTPYIIMVPNSEYITGVEEDAAVRQGKDTWTMNEGETAYIASFNLKAEAEQRLGDLEINKKLNTFDKSLGTATFVYRVDAKIGEEVVFSNVYTMNFNGAETHKITVKDIPAISEVTVTEVYSGASYEIDNVANQTKTAIVYPRDMVEEKEDINTASVSFINDFNNHLQIGGVSVVNEFTHAKDGKLEWKKYNSHDVVNTDSTGGDN